MGYYTDHSLEIKNIKSEEIFEKICDRLKEEQIVDYAIDEGHYVKEQSYAYFYCIDSVKWYTHGEDMSKISAEFPDCTFLLEGHGEDFGDFWREYYSNGQCEHCRGDITYEDPEWISW